jgi:ABC-type lipoprotein export system ATPase subunit
MIKEKYDIQNYKEPEIKIPDLQNKKGIILVVGTSGSGKSTILKKNGLKEVKINTDISIIENFSNEENAEKLLLAVGLRSIPTWFRGFNKVSNGERHRAEIALSIDQGNNCIDEFTSVVDRDTAKSLSFTLRKYFNKLKLEKLIIASCHRDIEEWLQPDWIYDADNQKFMQKDLLRPDIELSIISSTVKDWIYFKKHHYLTSEMSKSVHCYTMYWGCKRVGFLSVMHGTGYPITSYWRGSRLVILPEFQGLGFGKVLSDTIADEYTKRGYRYFTKTAHPALGEYRNKSPLWRATAHNMKKRKDYLVSLTQNGRFKKETRLRDENRITYAHEYIKNDIVSKIKPIEEW